MVPVAGWAMRGHGRAGAVDPLNYQALSRAVSFSRALV